MHNQNGTFSFLGVSFPDDKVTRVKITSGNAILGAGAKNISSGGSKDLVAMDDFIYDERRRYNRSVVLVGDGRSF